MKQGNNETLTYADAGVDIDAKQRAIASLREGAAWPLRARAAVKKVEKHGVYSSRKRPGFGGLAGSRLASSFVRGVARFTHWSEQDTGATVSGEGLCDFCQILAPKRPNMRVVRDLQVRKLDVLRLQPTRELAIHPEQSVYL